MMDTNHRIVARPDHAIPLPETISQAEYNQVTFYWHVGFTGYSKLEVRVAHIQTKPYAQCRKAVFIDFVRRGKRKVQTDIETSRASLVILAGWNHPDLPSAFHSTGHARYSAGDTQWSVTFDDFLVAYLHRSHATVLLDLRRHDPEMRVSNRTPPDALTQQPSTNHCFEGDTQEVVLSVFERDPNARQQCVKHHGYACSVCGFHFLHTYGAIGRDFIHVHHLVPLSTIRTGHPVDPIQALRPICPNCHSMIHRKEPPFTIEELKFMLIQQASDT